MVIAVAWLAVFSALLSFLLIYALTPALGTYNAFELTSFVNLILSSIIVGYVWAQEIQEQDRVRTTADIAALFAVLATFIALVEASIAERTPYIKAEYLKANPAASPSAFEWHTIEMIALGQEIFLVVVFAFALTFIGLYIGSILKKATKT